MLREFYPSRAICPFLLILLSATLSYSQPDIGYMELIQSTDGLSQPIELSSAPGDAAGRLFIVQKTGEIRIWTGTTVLPTPFLNINALVQDVGEQGLLSMAFHPQYATNGFFYVYYNDNTEPNGNITVARYQVSGNPDIASPGSATILASIPKPFENHNGGHLQFRVEAGVPYLYFATGDGGNGNDPFNNAQNPASLLGKMLRINVDAPSPPVEVWGRGLRNPFRWSFDRSTGDMWIADVGQGTREEINFLPAASISPNFGWPCREGKLPNGAAPGSSDCDTVSAVAIDPIFDYPTGNDSGRSVIGGYVYRGAAFPSLQGYYLVTDYFSNRLLLIQPDGGGWSVVEKTPTPVVSNIASISEDGSGELYAISLTGNSVYQITVPIVTPLLLTKFSGKPYTGYNELLWTAESEQNIEKFVVEYSKDGSNFIAVGNVTSLNDGNTNTYSFRHLINDFDKAYYRLRINEMNNTHSYSAVITIGGERVTGVKVYPTIIRNAQLNVLAGYPVEKVRITSMSGQEVFAKDMNGAEGFFMVNLPGLQRGLYVVSVQSKEELVTRKILID
jgi:glucose/arabinose dehydrogenase